MDMGTLGQHESFGEIAAFKGTTRAVSVVCLVPTELLIITRLAINADHLLTPPHSHMGHC